MTTFEYYFGVKLGFLLLKHSDNLSKTLQKTKLSAAEGQSVASLRGKTSGKTRTDDSYHLSWERCNNEAKDLEIGKAEFPKKKAATSSLLLWKCTDKISEQCGKPLPIYFLDTVIGFIKKLFEQNDYTTYYSKLESLLLCSAKGESCEKILSFVCNFYKDDFDKHKLETQLCSLPGTFEDKEVTEIHMVVKKFQKMSADMRAHFSEVVILIKLLLMAPATNAVSECCCSTLRRIKTYLRTRMTQNRMNNTIIMNTYKEELDKLDMIQVTNEFFRECDERNNVFGKFSKKDYLTIHTKRTSVATQTC